MNIIVQFAAVFNLLLYKYVFYRYRSIVGIRHSVYRYLYRYFARNSVIFIGILSVFEGKFGLCNIFETPLAALHSFQLHTASFGSGLGMILCLLLIVAVAFAVFKYFCRYVFYCEMQCVLLSLLAGHRPSWLQPL